MGWHGGKSRAQGLRLFPAAFSCLGQVGKADLATQGWDLPGKKLDEEGSEGRRGLRDEEKVQGQ